EDAFQLVPERLPVIGFKIERVDILILFGWVFGVLDTAVGSLAEPLGVFLDVGMVGRTLKGDVQGDFDALFPRRADEILKVFQGTQVGVNRLVSAFAGADSPRAADVIRSGLGGVVLAFAI